MVISGITLIIFSGVTGNAIPIVSIPWQTWAAIGYLVVFGSVISFIAYLYALQNLPTEQASIYAYINPMVAVILGAIIFGEKLTLYLAIGGAVTLLGVYLVNRAYKTHKVLSGLALSEVEVLKTFLRRPERSRSLRLPL